MSEAAAVPARPETITSAKLPESKNREPWELQDRLGRNKIIEKILNDFSGMGGNTSEVFQKNYAILTAMDAEGFDVEEDLIMLREYARISGDTQGKNKTQIIQVVEEKPVLLPGAAGLYPPVEPDPGIIRKIANKLFGDGKTSSGDQA